MRHGTWNGTLSNVDDTRLTRQRRRCALAPPRSAYRVIIHGFRFAPMRPPHAEVRTRGASRMAHAGRHRAASGPAVAVARGGRGTSGWTSEGLVGTCATAKPQPRGSTEPATYYRGACTTKSRTIDSTGWQPNASTALAAALPTSTLFDLSRTHHGLWD